MAEPVTGHPALAPKPLLRGVSHGLAFVLFALLGWRLVASAPPDVSRAPLVVYALSMLGLFGVSATYHLGPWHARARRVWRRLDHSMIFVAIAGTVTGVVGTALVGAWRTTLLVVVWAGAAAGIAVRMVWFDSASLAVGVPYVALGWVTIVAFPVLLQAIGWGGLGLMLLAGVLYTLGAVVLGRRWPDPWPRVFGYHEVFHLMVIAAALTFYVVVVGFAMPAHPAA